MIVRCIGNEPSGIESEAVKNRLREAVHIDGPDRDITIGELYPVYAVEYRNGGYWFFIHSVPQNEYPLPFPAEYFEIVDASIPPGWSVKFNVEMNVLCLKRISFYDWAIDDSFYEKLIDGNIESKKAYLRQMRDS